jgi:hypothetical protein
MKQFDDSCRIRWLLVEPTCWQEAFQPFQCVRLQPLLIRDKSPLFGSVRTETRPKSSRQRV